MALPQGINFRASAGYVTDGANEDYDIASRGAYPWTTAQGNNVGWITQSSVNYRDRTTGNDRRIAGSCFIDTDDFRIDLPSTGDYNVGIAAGDANYAQEVNWELFDNTSSLGTLTTGSTSAGERFKDATNTEYTDSTWPTSQTLVTKTFTSTIMKVSATEVTGQWVAHIYVESAGAAPRRWILGRP